MLSNAVEFTPEGGAIGLEVDGDAEKQAVYLNVWETDIGISQEDIKRLFDGPGNSPQLCTIRWQPYPSLRGHRARVSTCAPPG